MLEQTSLTWDLGQVPPTHTAKIQHSIAASNSLIHTFYGYHFIPSYQQQIYYSAMIELIIPVLLVISSTHPGNLGHK